MSLNTLSVVGNILQVVGFADTVIRAGTSLYDLLVKSQAASRNLSLLLSELQALLRVVTNVRIFLAEYAASPFAEEDASCVQTTRSILTLTEQEFRYLKGAIQDLSPAGWQGYWSKLASSFRWAMSQEEIDAACQRLSRYAGYLTTSLTTSGRRDDMMIRTDIQAIKLQLQSITTMSTKSTSRVPEQQSHYRKIADVVASRPKIKIRMLEGPRAVKPKRQKPSTSVPLERSSQSPVMVLPTNMTASEACSSAKVSIYETADQALVLDHGMHHLHDLARPLLLIADQLIGLRSAIQKSIGLSDDAMGQLGLILDYLRATCHYACAENIMNFHQDRAILSDCNDTREALFTFRPISQRPSADAVSDVYLKTQNWELSMPGMILSGELVQMSSTMDHNRSVVAAFHVAVSPLQCSDQGLSIQYVGSALRALVLRIPSIRPAEWIDVRSEHNDSSNPVAWHRIVHTLPGVTTSDGHDFQPYATTSNNGPFVSERKRYMLLRSYNYLDRLRIPRNGEEQWKFYRKAISNRIYEVATAAGTNAKLVGIYF